MNYNETEVRLFKEWLQNMAESGDYEHGDFQIADGVSVEMDWEQERDEPQLLVSILIHGPGFQLFTRGTGDTLAETGSYGHGKNHGDTIGADVGGWIAKNFTDQFDEIVFEYSEKYNGNAWLFSGYVPNPNFDWEAAPK